MCVMVWSFTTRKPEKSNGITDGNNSVSKSVGIYRRNHSVGNAVGIYRRNDSVGIYHWFTDRIYISSGNTQRHGDVRRFYWWKVPRDSNCDSRTVTWRCHRRHNRRNHRRKESVGDSVRKSHYMHPSADTLILCFSFFFFPIPPLPSQTPPKLQSNTHPKLSTILNTSTQISYILYVVTISVSCRFYHFFVSKSIIFN